VYIYLLCGDSILRGGLKAQTDVHTGSNWGKKSCVRVGLNPELGLTRPRSFLIASVLPPALLRFAKLQFKRCKNKHDIFWHMFENTRQRLLHLTDELYRPYSWFDSKV
jgi:hypothetical protein